MEVPRSACGDDAHAIDIGGTSSSEIRSIPDPEGGVLIVNGLHDAVTARQEARFAEADRLVEAAQARAAARIRELLGPSPAELNSLPTTPLLQRTTSA